MSTQTVVIKKVKQQPKTEPTENPYPIPPSNLKGGEEQDESSPNGEGEGDNENNSLTGHLLFANQPFPQVLVNSCLETINERIKNNYSFIEPRHFLITFPVVYVALDNQLVAPKKENEVAKSGLVVVRTFFNIKINKIKGMNWTSIPLEKQKTYVEEIKNILLTTPLSQLMSDSIKLTKLKSHQEIVDNKDLIGNDKNWLKENVVEYWKRQRVEQPYELNYEVLKTSPLVEKYDITSSPFVKLPTISNKLYIPIESVASVSVFSTYTYPIEVNTYNLIEFLFNKEGFNKTNPTKKEQEEFTSTILEIVRTITTHEHSFLQFNPPLFYLSLARFANVMRSREIDKITKNDSHKTKEFFDKINNSFLDYFRWYLLDKLIAKPKEVHQEIK